MASTVILLNQIIIMFIYIAVGYALRSGGLIAKDGSATLSNLLLYIILPCVIIKSYSIEATAAYTQLLLVSLALGALVLIIAMAISALVLRRNPAGNFSGAFSNAGFMGVPLISAVLGDEAVFCIAGMVALLNILQWTYGQAVLAKDWRACAPKAIAKSPLVIAFLLGLLVYILPISLPTQLYTAVSSLASCNGPVAMIILGVMLRDVQLREMVRPAIWGVCAIRLLVVPAVTALVLSFFVGFSETLCVSLLLAAAAPVGTNVAIYVRKLGGDAGPAVSMVCLSTVLSAVTMPLIYLLFQMLVGTV